VPIVLGGLAFDENTTAVSEKQEEVGGRDARSVRISGVLAARDVAGLEAAFDAIVAAAGDGESETVLCLRPGRRLLVRRTGFTREIARERRTGAFVLDLEARDPYESSQDVNAVAWEPAAGNTLACAAAGNIHALPVLTLVAGGEAAAPGFGDGTRAIAYTGTLYAGQTLVFDAAAGRVTLDGEDVTPYTTGEFPRIEPGGTTLAYTDESPGSPAVSVTVAWRDRWW
jgi:hypothetical protein